MQAVKSAIIFTNPVTGSFNVDINPSYHGTLRLIDIIGNVLITADHASGVQHIDMTGNHSGIYFLRFDSNKGTFTRKVILK